MTLDEAMARIGVLENDLSAANARVTAVSDEAKGYRLNLGKEKGLKEVAETALASFRTESAAAAEAARTAAGEALTKAEGRARTAALRLAAKEAGAVDPGDLLALIPADRLKTGEDGEISNAADVLAELKAAKPYLFGTASTASTATPPKQEAAQAKSALAMTDEEWRAARAAVPRS